VQRFAATLFAIFMLAHALVPGLPTYVCTDGGRSLSPCAPPENEGPAQAQAEWHVGDCCKLTEAAKVDAQAPLLLMRFDEPPISRRGRLTRGDPLFRGPPSSLRSILRI
jgi:hypothetical protein